MNVARTISGFENLARLSQVSEQRVVTFILLAMRIESSKRPSNLIACLNHGAVHIYRQTVQTQSLDLLVDQYTGSTPIGP